jgi:hypothetical protein
MINSKIERNEKAHCCSEGKDNSKITCTRLCKETYQPMEAGGWVMLERECTWVCVNVYTTAYTVQ